MPVNTLGGGIFPLGHAAFPCCTVYPVALFLSVGD
jgi:hypothetical protein